MSPTDPKHSYPVRCIDSSPWVSNAPTGLTQGKCYMAVDYHTTEDRVQVYNDLHMPCLYDRSRFEPIPLCKYCGNVINLSYHNELNQKLADNQECFHCGFWRTISLRMENDNQFFVVDNEVYHNWGDGQTSMGTKGFGGYRWYIKTDDGRFITTDSLWPCGEPSPVWRDKFPNNAHFMDAEDWRADKQASENGCD